MSSPWGAPVPIRQKKDGSFSDVYRLQRMETNDGKDRYPQSPRITTYSTSCKGPSIYSKIDLRRVSPVEGFEKKTSSRLHSQDSITKEHDGHLRQILKLLKKEKFIPSSLSVNSGSPESTIPRHVIDCQSDSPIVGPCRYDRRFNRRGFQRYQNKTKAKPQKGVKLWRLWGENKKQLFDILKAEAEQCTNPALHLREAKILSHTCDASKKGFGRCGQGRMFVAEYALAGRNRNPVRIGLMMPIGLDLPKQIQNAL
ncbi:hypothetical protein Tco_1457336 [Tanacetum coccineum]